jgi:uncharacterized protein (TIGR03086 family)
MDAAAAHARAAEEFARRLATVGPDDWDLPTPCADWTVTDLVRHAIGGNEMAVHLLAGAERDEVLAVLGRFELAPDRVAQFRSTASAVGDALTAGPPPAVVHHLMGDIPGDLLVQFRTTDLLVHAWDLARAIGGDEVLDSALVAAVHEQVAPMAPALATSGVFDAPPRDLGEDAPEQDRLLNLLGRAV